MLVSGRADDGSRWRSHCFGLDLDSEFAIAGCPASEPGPRPHVILNQVSGSEVRSSLGAGERTVISRVRRPDGRLTSTVVAHPEHGYLLSAVGLAAFHVNLLGTEIGCSPAGVARWRWQRHLIGQVLPFVSALRGYETFHASAVVTGGRAVMLSGGSGAGKSSLAAALALTGSPFLADDVVALEPVGGAVIAHPGAPLVSLRTTTVRQLGQAQIDRLGRRVGEDAHGVRLAVTRHDDPSPVAALFLLERTRGRTARFARLPTPDPRTLLGATFNFVLRTPARLVTHLDVCAAIASSVAVFRLEMPADADYEGIARRLTDKVTASDPTVPAAP